MGRLLKLKQLNSSSFIKNTKKVIKEITEVTNRHVLSPELSLHLITSGCPLWRSRYEDSPFPDPFWAFYWPGGEGLTRYILNNKSIVYRKNVLDLGSGCGSVAIAAAKVGGAASITANDIDPVAAVAIEMNAQLNDCTPNSITINTENLVEEPVRTLKYDCILLGDMFYDEQFSVKLIDWLLPSLQVGAEVFIGDPGRNFVLFEKYRDIAKLVKTYKINEKYKVNNDLTSDTINIWKLSDAS